MIRVVVVDDDFRVANVHAAYVGRVPDFSVVAVAHTARAAIEAARHHVPELMLLDQYLPDAPGTWVLPQVSCDVMMLTAAADGVIVREALRLGAVNYLLKPFAEGELASRLRAYARYRSQVAAAGELEQSAIDRAMRALHDGDAIEPATRKGRSAHTAQLVVEAVREAHRAVTAGDVADLVGVSRGTAQRYLSDLAAQGRLRVRLRYGSGGRPEHLYSADAIDQGSRSLTRPPPASGAGPA